MDLCHCRPTFVKSALAHTHELLLSTPVTPHKQQKTSFHRVTKQKPDSSLFSEWRLDDFSKFIQPDSMLVCRKTLYSTHTKKKERKKKEERCSKMTGRSPKNIASPSRESPPKIHKFQCIISKDICFSYLFLGAGLWILCTCQNSTHFPAN